MSFMEQNRLYSDTREESRLQYKSILRFYSCYCHFILLHVKENSQPDRKMQNTQKKYELDSLSVLLQGTYFLWRLRSIGFGPVLGFAFLSHKLYRGTNLLYHSEGVENTLNS